MKSTKYSLAAIIIGGALMFGLVSPAITHATVPGDNDAIDLNVNNGDPDNTAGDTDTSHDGRYIVFQSTATNLVSPSTNGLGQIFVRDRLNNVTTMVSVSSDGVQGNKRSVTPKISASGRYVVFQSSSTNLVASDNNAESDVFLHDLDTQTTQLVSRNASGIQGNHSSGASDVSADGEYVVFVSSATNLVSSPTVTNGGVYVKNTSTGDIKMVSQSATGVAANSNNSFPGISCEGRFVIFQSYANNLVSGDTDNPTKSKARVYVVDMLKAVDPLQIGGSSDGHVAYGSISCSGGYIAFVSDASNIIPNDTNGSQDGFVYDRINASYERISINSNGDQTTSGSVGEPSISNDGKYVVFSSSATNLVSGDTNGTYDIFLRNRQTGITELISKDSNDVIGNGMSIYSVISADGQYVTYLSYSSNLVSGANGTIYASKTGVSSGY